MFFIAILWSFLALPNDSEDHGGSAGPKKEELRPLIWMPDDDKSDSSPRRFINRFSSEISGLISKREEEIKKSGESGTVKEKMPVPPPYYFETQFPKYFFESLKCFREAERLTGIRKEMQRLKEKYPKVQESLSELVLELDNNRYSKRVIAEQKLTLLGESAIEDLEKARPKFPQVETHFKNAIEGAKRMKEFSQKSNDQIDQYLEKCLKAQRVNMARNLMKEFYPDIDFKGCANAK